MSLALALLAGGLAVPPGPAPVLPDDGPGCAHAKAAAHRWDVEQDRGPALVDAGDTDVLHYHLDIELDPAAQWIGGSNTIQVRCLTDGLTEFVFRLSDRFTLEQVEVGGASAPWVRLDEANVEVTLDQPYDLGDEFEVHVRYAGSPPSTGFGSIEFRTRNGAPEVWTLSEPWFSYTWWPAKDDNTDKTTADLWFTVPDTMVVASNGLLQGVDAVSGSKLRYRWQTLYPTADYLYCIGATNYHTFHETWNYDGWSMPLDFYLYPEDDTAGNRAAWRLNLDMLDVFSDRYGVYPFVDEKYGMCQVGFGGGMEHQTMTSQGGFWESITAHELGHQWFGDMITCATWHDIWLNEGFATFSEAIWYGDEPGGGGMQAYHDRMEARRPRSVDGSVYVYDTSSVNRIFSSDFTYRKGAWVVHMLRHVLGDETFFDVLARYRTAYAFDSATTEDLRLVAEGVTGRDLAWFFDEWIYDIGAPAYRSAWRLHTVAGRPFVELYLQQTQSGDYPTFTMPVDLAISGVFGSTVEVVWNDERAEHLLFEVPDVVSSLAVDPEDWILHTSNGATGFVEGPPKVVVVTPAPGATVEASDDLVVTVTFHKDVDVTAGDLTLVGDVTGLVPVTIAYDAGAYTATLEPVEALAADTYTLTIADTIVDVAAGRALDGEIADATDPAALPSGDGLPGGDGQVRFTVTPLGPIGDVNGDGVVDFADLLEILAAWGPCAGCPADVDGSGVVDFGDILVVLSNWS